MTTKQEKQSELAVQADVRLEAAEKHKRLFRNNVGAASDRHGRPIRYGLANDSKALNKVIKSGDLIGWETIVITPDMVGQPIARFLSIECKPEGWTPSANDEHEQAQRRWADMVNAAGGRALFVSKKGML
jgi:hypothetical protein